MKNKFKILSGITVVIVAMLVVKFIYSQNRSTIKWAKELTEEDVAKIEMTIFPSENGKCYKAFDEEDIEWIVDIINDAKGKYVSKPEELSGGSFSLYIIMKDGDVHCVQNIGNTYMVIDGDSFEAKYEYLENFAKKLGTGESEIPLNAPYIQR